MKKNPPIKNEYTHKEPSPYRSNPNKDDVLFSKEGQWKYPGQVTKVPSGDITMRGVNYPVLGVDNYGNQQMMMPEMEYSFPGQYVTEHPINLNMPQITGDNKPAFYGRGSGNLKNVQGIIGANFGANNLEVKMGIPTHNFNPSLGIKYSRTFQDGGGPNPGIDPPVTRTASNIGAVNEDELFDQYEQIKKQLEEEHKRVSKVRGNLIPAAQALDKADSKILADKNSPAYKAFQKSRFATTPEELKKAIQEYPEELKNVLPGRGNYNIGLADPKKYKGSDELYCTPYGCFTYQKAGAHDVPTVAGNFGFVGGVKEGKLPFKKVSASEAEPGDMAIVYGMQPADYRGDPTAAWVDRPHHTTVLAGKPTFDKKGKPTGFPMYNANEGNRLNYQKEYRDAATRKDTGYEFYRYVGQTPQYEQQLQDIKGKIQATPIQSLQAPGFPLPTGEEPELKLKKEGGWLDELSYGGTPSSLQQQKAKRGKTSKNIQSSINKIFLRNHTLYGYSGKNIYDPNVKFELGGGWLDDLT